MNKSNKTTDENDVDANQKTNTPESRMVRISITVRLLMFIRVNNTNTNTG
eukprot:CAMPEP_0179879080 /NCGR_PEP_ID=MMETSP0982-20121206/25961_1 /TAXON_ID=483367 /ORGANISM="non described non described, Strain CCMP 2436" /LENGTH=49 /DNA_ID= /DNA_START= /DNA_END= /DNA_ORIENTATION=